MELACYLAITSLSVLFSAKRYILSNSTVFFLTWSATYISLILIIRSEFDSDIATYAAAMTGSTMSLYYLKEPVIWVGQRYIFSFVQDPYLVFVITDLLTGAILFQALKNFKLPQYAFFSFLIFFPTILGMQNIYRQWVATVLLLYSFSLITIDNNSKGKYLAFTLSVLSHNAAAIFVPILFINEERAKGRLLWYTTCIIAVYGIKLGAEHKSSANTGSDLTFVYLTLIMFFIFLIPVLDHGTVRKLRKFEYKLLSLLLILSSCSILFLSSAGAERVSMMCLMIAYPILVLLFENRFKQNQLPRSVYSLLGFLPMFFFSVSSFILNGN